MEAEEALERREEGVEIVDIGLSKEGSKCFQSGAKESSRQGRSKAMGINVL